MTIDQARELRDNVFADNEIKKLYELGDQNSIGKTRHDEEHARQVHNVATALVDGIHKRKRILSQQVQDIVIPLAAYLHDVGRAIDENTHAQAGARWARTYLSKMGFEKPAVNAICRVIACHRSETVLKKGSLRGSSYRDAAWAIVVIADKAVGDENRVRPAVQRMLAEHQAQGRMDQWQGNIHDRINFAIKNSCLIIEDEADPKYDLPDDPGAIVLKLQIDTAVCQPAHIYNLYRDRFHACGKAAKYLGFIFRLEFNGVRYAYCQEKDDWVAITRTEIPV